MAIALNEYATKAFSEHPLAIWSLDDDAYFISNIEDETIRYFDAGGWTYSPNLTVEDSPDEPGIVPPPFVDSPLSMFYTLTPYTGEVVEIVSPPVFTFNSLNQSLGSFCINFWLFQRSVGVIRYEVGYKYLNSDNEEIEVVDIFEGKEEDRDTWINFNITDPIPVNRLSNSWLKIVIRLVLAAPASETQEYKFLFNGLSAGQWSENACFKNLGSNPVDVPDLDFSGSVSGIQADQYGLLSEFGYYLVEDKQLLADNNGLTLVFGSENSTNIYPSKYGNPSFIFPGKDMLHEMGRYKQFSLEMWLTVDPSTNISRRILGPLGNDFGVYVKKGSISLVVGNSIASHAISEWYRPMLLHLLIEDSTVSMLINGEQVATVPLDRTTIDLPSDKNWWGVYSYEDIGIFKIDCISVYPYIFPLQVAKKRFVWGQGVDTLQFIDSQFSGKTAAVDFATANYDVNQIYPDVGRWDAGYFDNLSVSQSSLSMPRYSLPSRYLGGEEGTPQARGIEEWYSVNKEIVELNNTEPFVTFRPNLGERYNLMYKPSLEILKWTYYGTSNGEFSNDYFFVGSQSLKITLAGEDTAISGPHGFDDFIINRIGIYWASAYFYVPEDPEQQLDGKTITLSLEDGWQGVTVIETNVATLNLGEWVRASIKFEVTNTTYLGRIVARISENINGQVLYTDAWMLEEGQNLGQYFDGSTSEYATWIGNEHSSISMLPIWQTRGSDWNELCYYKFDWMRMFTYPINSLYGIFEVVDVINEDRPLIYLVNGNDTIKIKINGLTVYYQINNEEPFYSEDILINNKFVVGINIEKLSRYFGFNVLPFFTSAGSIKMYAAGDPVSRTTFEGKVYKIGFLNQSNYETLERRELDDTIDNEWAFTTFFERTLEGGEPDSLFEETIDGGIPTDFPPAYFNEYGVTTSVYVQDFQNFYSMYAMIPMLTYNRLFLDIEVRSEWEEYYPLSYFSTYIKDSDLNPKYDLDFLQLNIGYANRKEVLTAATEQDSWFYGPIINQVNGKEEPGTLYYDYHNPVIKTYSAIDNEVLTNFDNYEQLRRNAQIEEVYDFKNSSFRGYVTFQFLNDGTGRPLSEFQNLKRLDQSKVIIADDINSPTDPALVFNTKFEWIDNTVIYPPKTANISGQLNDLNNMVMVVHFLVTHRGILSTPIEIRNFEISSKTFNETTPTAIGTKYGVPMYPYVKENGALRYKDKNPVLLYKGNTPYLYMTNTSGISIGNKTTGNKEYGVRIPANEGSTKDFAIGGFQFWGKYEFTKFPINGIPVAEIDHLDQVVEIVVYRDHSPTRGVIRARDKRTGNEYTNVAFYQNGVYVKYPVVKKNEWNSIGILFPEPLSFEFYEGSINLFAGMTFNNIAYYSPEGLGRLSNVLTRPWLRILRPNLNSNQAQTWNYWYYEDPINRITNSWKRVLVESESSTYVSTPSDVHKVYVGTNKNIVDDDNSFNVKNRQFAVINAPTWTRISDKPV